MLRDGEFSQITKDDTYVQMLVDEGRISPEEASSHPQRSLLTRALDGRDIDPEYSVRQVLPGDRYMICSDGLSSVVSADTIGESLRDYRDPQDCVERLVALALRGGGPDNITVIVADASDQDIVEAAPIVGGAAARDRGMTSAAGESTPAARASALTSPRPAAPDNSAAASSAGQGDAETPHRHPVRTALLLVVLVGLLGGGLWYGWRYTQSQYYVGATDGGAVAVFRGVPGQIAGLDLSAVRETSNTQLDELTSIAQDRVKQGIPAHDEADAKRKLAELTSQDPSNTNMKPPCSPSPGTSASPSTSASHSPSVSGSASPSVSAHPSGSVAAGSGSASGGSLAGSASSTASVSATDGTSPGVDPSESCRAN
jgi:protein phosphatase